MGLEPLKKEKISIPFIVSRLIISNGEADVILSATISLENQSNAILIGFNINYSCITLSPYINTINALLYLIIIYE